MEYTKLDSGDNGSQLTLNDKESSKTEITPQMIDDNEAKLKERIAQCKNIIESLKMELNEEKSKSESQNSAPQRFMDNVENCTTSNVNSTSNLLIEDLSYNSCSYSNCVHNKLSYDANLIEYEKQLQRFQNTLNMAQMEKKNAIRKQMLTKAYHLKLLEVENQCNIELLRVKQSLQCLEPLKQIASKWRTSSDDMCDDNSYELIPRYPELNANSNCDLDISDIKIHSASEEVTKDSSISSST